MEILFILGVGWFKEMIKKKGVSGSNVIVEVLRSAFSSWTWYLGRALFVA